MGGCVTGRTFVLLQTPVGDPPPLVVEGARISVSLGLCTRSGMNFHVDFHSVKPPLPSGEIGIGGVIVSMESEDEFGREVALILKVTSVVNCL